MFPSECAPTRRTFLTTAAALSSAVAGTTFMPEFAFSTESELSDVNVVGPKKGYSPQIAPVSMMTWMRSVILMPLKGMTQKDLDFLLDEKANSIGALLLHLAATDRLYHVHTFQNVALKDLPEPFKEKWGMPMELGEPARKGIKGHDLDYYLNILRETREETLAQFRKRDDTWLMTVDKEWGWGRPTITASGSTSASMNPITMAKLNF